MSKKTLTCYAYVPYRGRLDIDVPWEDVEVKYCNRRKRASEWLTIQKAWDLQGRIKQLRELYASLENKNIGSPTPSVSQLEEAKEHFEKTGNRFIILGEEDDYFEIWVNSPRLTRIELEEAIEWYFREKNLIGQVAVKFRWPRPELTIVPVGISCECGGMSEL